MKTILVVDDDLQLRGMLVLALTRQGYRVIEADSGASALILARQHLPDLILSDIHMPGGDGSTLLRDIRRDPELKSRQVVLMTGRPDLVTPRKGMEEGADDFLVKPVDSAALLSCLEARFSRATISWRVEDEMLAQLRTLVPAHLPHEFFTPLAGIIGLAEILRADFPEMPKEARDILGDIHQSALRLHRTLRNYLLILELQTDSGSVPPPALAPREAKERIRSGVAEALRHHARREDDVTTAIEDCQLPIQPEDLTRLVEELVDNALKFSRHGTPVKVRLTPDRKLIVTDAGRGLAPEQIAQIGVFRQFERHKHEQQGLGLGLVLVQKLTALCGADFSIESRPGEGTEVAIAFPAPG